MKSITHPETYTFTESNYKIMIQGKIWGHTEEIVKNSFFEIHRIEIKKGGFCSLHKHIHKNNMFYVEKGNINIEIHKLNYELIDITTLITGQMTIVIPGEFHKFIANEDSTVYEIYWLNNISEDIERKEVGGIISSQ